MGDYSEKEIEAIQELKSALKGEMENELYEDENLFYRFLKARDFNVSCAEKMLREHLEWREKHDLKNISKYKLPEAMEKYSPMIKLGYDKEGSVVRYMPSGNTDWIGLNASCKADDFTKFVAKNLEADMEDLKQQSIKFGKRLDKIVYISNYENFSFAQATDKKTISTTISLTQSWLNNYPETLKSVYVINASVYFGLLFSLLKKFLPATILQKIHIYSDDSWKKELLKVIDAEVLPAFLGGNRKDPDGNDLCLTFINHGGPVPEKYYIHRSKRSLANEPDVETITLQRASFHEVVLEVKEADSYLEWEFESKCRDAGFGIFYQDDEGNKTEIVPIQRINTDEYSESGIYKCENIGTYIVLFDNTYSVIRSKVIYYKIKVVSPEESASHLGN